MSLMTWNGKLQKDEKVTGYIPIALQNETMAQLTKPNGRRRYIVDIEDERHVFPSVTTEAEGMIRNFGLEKWKEAWIERGLDKYLGQTLTVNMVTEILTGHKKEAEASAYTGTKLHLYIERLLTGADVNDIPDQFEPAIQGFLRWRRKYIDWKHIGSELGVYSHKYMVAGTMDALFDTPDGYMIVDWKTSRGIYESHAIQASVYAEAFRDMTKKRKLAGAMVVRFDNNYPSNGLLKGVDRTKPKVFTDRVEVLHLPPEMCKMYAQEISDLRLIKSRHSRKLEKEML